MKTLPGRTPLVVILLLGITLLVPIGMRAVVAATPDETAISLDDDLEQLKQRFENEIEKMRAEFQRELERVQGTDQRTELRRARERIEELEQENARLRRAVRELRGAAGAGGEAGAERERLPEPRGERPRGMLGVTLSGADPELAESLRVDAENCVQITGIQAGSPAARMGLRSGDMITSFDGNEGNLEAFVAHMSKKRAGDEVVITYARRQESGDILRITGRTELMAWREPTATDLRPLIVAEPRNDPPPSRGPISLGVSVVASEAGNGVVVTDVTEDGNAAAAKIETDDRIVRFGESTIGSIDDLRGALQQVSSGDAVTIQFVRGGAQWQSRVRLSHRAGSAEILHGPDRVGGGEVRGDGGSNRQPGFLGIAIDPEAEGLAVGEVVAGSTAEAMGLLVGDRIVSVNDSRVRTSAELRSALTALFAGDRIFMTVRRGGARQNVEGTLGARPEEREQSRVPVASPARVRTVAARTAEAALVNAAAPTVEPRGELGVIVVEREGAVVIEEIPRGSAAGAAGARSGDTIRRIEGRTVDGFASIETVLTSRSAGDRIALTVERDGRPIELRVTLAGATRDVPLPSKPLEATTPVRQIAPVGTPHLGLEVEERADGIWIVAIDSGAPAASAGLRIGDRVLTLGGIEVTDLGSMHRAVDGLRGQESSEVTVWRGDHEERREVTPQPR